MKKTNLFLTVCIGLSLVLCSASLLIWSARQNTARAQVGTTLPNGIVIVGPALKGSGFSAYYYVLGYNPKDGQVVSLGRINSKDLD